MRQVTLVGGAIVAAVLTACGGGSVAQTQTRVADHDSHVETLQYNVPRAGFIYRAAATALSSTGTTVPVRERTSLGWIRAHFGINVAWLPDLGLPGAPGTFEFNVERP